MKLINVYVTTALVLLSLQSIAQKKDKGLDKPQFKRLYIGDTVPMENITFNKVRNYPGGKAKLSDFKGKYIILDFWTKGCSSCIGAFPHMEKLQNQFKDDIQILLITKNSEEDLASLTKNSPNLKNTKLPVVIDDQVLATQLFPHTSVPYHVWLDENGVIIATTISSETNAENLNKLISGKPLNLAIRNDIVSDEDPIFKGIRDQKVSLLKVQNGYFLKHLRYYIELPEGKSNNSSFKLTHTPSFQYYSMFMDWISGDAANQQYLFQDNIGNSIGFRMVNWSLDELYQMAYLKTANESFIDIAKIIVEGKAKMLYPDIGESNNMGHYKVNNSYCYESLIPQYSFQNARELMQRDLARFFGMIGNVEEREVKHLVITRLGLSAERRLWMKDQNVSNESNKMGVLEVGGIGIKNTSFKGFINVLKLANRRVGDPIIIDETGFNSEISKKKVDVKLKCQSLHAVEMNVLLIRKALSRYGLGLKEETRKVKVLVLKSVL